METFKLNNGRTLGVEYSEWTESPREWDNLTKCIFFGSYSHVGDKHNYNSNDYNGWDEMEQEAIASTHRRRGETFTTDIQLEQEIPAEWIKPMNKEQLKRDVVNFLASEDIRPLLPERKTNSQPRN